MLPLAKVMLNTRATDPERAHSHRAGGFPEGIGNMKKAGRETGLSQNSVRETQPRRLGRRRTTTSMRAIS